MVVHAIHLNQHRRKASADRQADRARKYLVTKKEETGNRPGEGLLLTFDHRQYAVMMDMGSLPHCRAAKLTFDHRQYAVMMVSIVDF